jgi:D-alanyl-D-alanine carboxypeptidase
VVEIPTGEVTSSTDTQSIDEEVGVQYRNVQVDNTTDLHFGTLASITVDNLTDYSFSSIEVVNLYDNKSSSAYSVDSVDDVISANVMPYINEMFNDFYEATGNDTALIRKTYLFEINDALDCDHEGAMSFDLYSYDGSTMESYDGTGDFEWIAERADKYGFILRYPSDKVIYTGNDEPNHFRYVGLPHSSYMKENNLCLEEYIATVKYYTYDNPLEMTTFNGRTYQVYYVPMDDDNSTTNIPVLMDKEYSISGDNSSGFIVTVKVSG